MPADACMNLTYHASLNGSMLRLLERREENASLVLVFKVDNRNLISQHCVDIVAVEGTSLERNSTCGEWNLPPDLNFDIKCLLSQLCISLVTPQVESSGPESYRKFE